MDRSSSHKAILTWFESKTLQPMYRTMVRRLSVANIMPLEGTLRRRKLSCRLTLSVRDSAVVSAPGSYPGGQRFESVSRLHLHHRTLGCRLGALRPCLVSLTPGNTRRGFCRSVPKQRQRGPVAQSVIEQRFETPCVGSSNLPGSTMRPMNSVILNKSVGAFGYVPIYMLFDHLP